MMMMMVTMMVNVCDDDCYLVMKVILVKEVMSCDVSPVAMFPLQLFSSPVLYNLHQRIWVITDRQEMGFLLEVSKKRMRLRRRRVGTLVNMWGGGTLS